MMISVRASLLLVVLVGCTSLLAQDAPARPVPTAVWAPKPTKLPRYTPPQKPWIKLLDLKAKHKGEVNWRELLVDDGRLAAEYFSAAPGQQS
jgi:hypothetical protein